MNEQKFCDYFRELRIKTGKTLRKFCEENNFDVGNVSKIERGVIAPPVRTAVMEKYAAALGLKKGAGRTRFFDLASAQNGVIPNDLMKDEKLAMRLPLLFRTIRDEKIDEKKMKELIEEMRGV